MAGEAVVAVPYTLKGTSIYRADTGKLVKKHPTKEKAQAHLYMLEKAHRKEKGKK